MAERKPSRTRNLSYTAVAGFAGCWITFVVLAALLLGLWFDARLGVRGLFTVAFVILSVPISLFIAVRIVLALVKQIQAPKTDQNVDSSSNGGG